jgi:hypothetical protein
MNMTRTVDVSAETVTDPAWEAVNEILEDGLADASARAPKQKCLVTAIDDRLLVVVA